MSWVFHIKERMSDILARAALSGSRRPENSLSAYLSENRILDLMRETGQSTVPLSDQENAYLDTRLIDLVNSPRFIFRRPWFMPLSVISPTCWKVKDLLEGRIYTVNVKRVGDYLYYKFSQGR